MKLKSIKLVTENCEVYGIDAEHVILHDYCYFNNITSQKQSYTERVIICFKHNAGLNENESVVFYPNEWNQRTDITVVDFNYDDGSVVSINLCWPEGEEHRNLTEHPGQKWEVDSDGNFSFTHDISYLNLLA